MPNILDKLAAASQARVAREKRETPLETLMARCQDENLPPRRSFENALKAEGISFICEVKRASPSAGVIAEDFPYQAIAAEYEAAGAACVSVLTEPEYFLGNDRYLREIARAVSIPVLRKDFTVDAYQLYQARLLGADAVLLICAILDAARLAAYLETAYSLGLSALVEVHDESEMSMALSAGAKLIGVNNRDLKTFEVDIHNSLRLRSLAPPGVLLVAESGIRNRADVARLEAGGVDAVLVGESLMRAADRRAALKALMGLAP